MAETGEMNAPRSGAMPAWMHRSRSSLMPPNGYRVLRTGRRSSARPAPTRVASGSSAVGQGALAPVEDSAAAGIDAGHGTREGQGTGLFSRQVNPLRLRSARIRGGSRRTRPAERAPKRYWRKTRSAAPFRPAGRRGARRRGVPAGRAKWEAPKDVVRRANWKTLRPAMPRRPAAGAAPAVRRDTDGRLWRIDVPASAAPALAGRIWARWLSASPEERSKPVGAPRMAVPQGGLSRALPRPAAGGACSCQVMRKPQKAPAGADRGAVPGDSAGESGRGKHAWVESSPEALP